MASAAVRRFWDRVADLGCIVCGRPAEIAHAHSGSLLDRGILHAKGKKLARMDWLVLPLCEVHHRVEYGGLDADVRAWERLYGLQTTHLDAISRRLGVSIWELAGEAPSRGEQWIVSGTS